MDNRKDANFWWKSKLGSQIHDTINGYVEHLRDVSLGDRNKDAVHSVLYHNDQVFSGPYASALRIMSARGFSAVRLNISKNIVDTLTAKISKNHPSIKIATDGADWSSRLKGRKMGKFINAKLDITEFKRIAPQIFRDCLIRGTGIVKITSENGELCPERVSKDDLLIDPLEARYGKPRQMHQVYIIAREVLIDMFPEDTKDIMAASSHNEDDSGYMMNSEINNSNMIRVVESWHLPSGPDAGDGRHAICIQNKTLLHDTWDRDTFPFAFIHWSAPDKGFWGTGLIEELAPIQWEIDNTIQTIGDSLQVGGKLKVFIPRGSKINPQHLKSNKIGTFIEYSGQLPHFVTPEPVSEQVFRYLDLLFNKASQISGVSEMSSQSKIPSRLGDSKPAIQAIYDIETERFSPQAMAYGDFYLDVAAQFLHTFKELHENDSEYSGKWVDKDTVECIKWSEVDMDKDQYKLKVELLNKLPDTRAGKLATIKELTEIGLLPQQLLGTALQSPDLEKIYSIINAAHDNIQWVIGQLEDVDADFPEPEPYQDLQLGINLVKATYNENMAIGAPEEVQERLQEWIQNAASVLKIAKGAQGPQTAPGAQAPSKGVVAPGAMPPGAGPEPLPPGPIPGLPPGPLDDPDAPPPNPNLPEGPPPGPLKGPPQ